jgi:hypothetical protein
VLGIGAKLLVGSAANIIDLLISHVGKTSLGLTNTPDLSFHSPQHSQASAGIAPAHQHLLIRIVED